MSARGLDRAGRLAVPAVSVALALVLLLGIGVAALRTPTASAATVLQRGTAVTAVLEDGTTTRLAEGDEVPRGSVVTAGPDGAVLRTRDRDTWLSGGAVVRVLDGARQELRDGFVMVDARRGPELEVAAPSAVVTAPRGGVTRIEDGRLLRVGSYGGDPVTVRAAGRAADVEVPRSRQVQVPAGGLPGRVTPLVLTPGDDYERALASELVAADEALTDVAARLDGDGRPAVLVRTAADTDLPGTAAALPADAPTSERTLAYLLARAAADDVAAGFREVRGLRAEGGSWGVVADLVDAEVSEVAALLDALLGTTAVTLAAEQVDVPALLGVGAPTAAPSGAPDPADPVVAAPAPTSPPQQPGDEPPASGPPPAPTPTGVLDAVVDTVLDLLPLETGRTVTTTTVPALPSDPVPSPAPSPSPGLLDGLLGR